jgi:type IV secretion system protein VirD4
MKTIRFILIAAMLLSAYIGVLATIIFPWLGLPLVLGVLFGLARKRSDLTAYGTAKWATAQDIPHMLKGNGLIVGHIEGKPSKWAGIMALFDRRRSAADAVERYLASCKRKPPRHLVRLTSAVHTAVFAPTGVGKGVSCVIPHLLTCPDSMVVVDFKGENALLTAEHRARTFGHKIVILDPFKVVTQ